MRTNQLHARHADGEPVRRSSESSPAERILVLEDAPDLRDLLAFRLRAAGFAVSVGGGDVDTASSPWDPAPRPVLIDVVRPKESGVRNVDRALSGDRPLVVLLLGERELAELVDQVGAILSGRRHSSPTAVAKPQTRRYLVGSLELDPDAHRAWVSGHEVKLTVLEARFLAYLVEHREQVIRYRDVLRDVWDYDPRVASRTHSTHLRRLRIKLGAGRDVVETVRGLGYRLSPKYPVEVRD